jgi:uncharacterized protein (DUF433 family)
MQPVMTPYIELRKNARGQERAYVTGTRVRVSDIYLIARDEGVSPDQLAECFPLLSRAQIHAALAYYFDNSEELLAELREDEEFAAWSRERAAEQWNLAG